MVSKKENLKDLQCTICEKDMGSSENRVFGLSINTIEARYQPIYSEETIVSQKCLNTHFPKEIRQKFLEISE